MAVIMYCWHAIKLEGIHRAVARPCVDQIRHIISHEDIWGSGGIGPSCPGRFNPRNTAAGNHRIGGRVSSKAGLEAMEKSLLLFWESNLDSSIIQPVT
jgi:hypothetical protein